MDLDGGNIENKPLLNKEENSDFLDDGTVKWKFASETQDYSILENQKMKLTFTITADDVLPVPLRAGYGDGC